MKQDAELLNFVYQNAQMGVETIHQILKAVEHEGLKKQLQRQMEEYEAFQKEAAGMLEQNGYDEKGIRSFEKIRTYLMVNFQTMTDRTTSHIAEMMMIGSNMGVIQAVKNLKKYDNVEKNVKDLMERLRKKEEQNLEKLKEFL